MSSISEEEIDCSGDNLEEISHMIVEECGYKLNYIEFFKIKKFKNLTYSIWNNYCVITHNGLTLPTAFKQELIYQEIIKPMWFNIFVESRLDKILFDFWDDCYITKEKIMVDYVFQKYGSELTYTRYVSIQEVPAETYNLYRIMQLDNKKQ